jgi:1,4-alpha-glucan branching enzyme
VVVLNLTPVPRPNYRLGAPEAVRYRVALNSDAPQYGGSAYPVAEVVESEAVPYHGFPQSFTVSLPPLGMLVLMPESLPELVTVSPEADENVAITDEAGRAGKATKGSKATKAPKLPKAPKTPKLPKAPKTPKPEKPAKPEKAPKGAKAPKPAKSTKTATPANADDVVVTAGREVTAPASATPVRRVRPSRASKPATPAEPAPSANAAPAQPLPPATAPAKPPARRRTPKPDA